MMTFYAILTIFSIFWIPRFAPTSYSLSLLSGLVCAIISAYHFCILYSLHETFKGEFEQGFLPTCHHQVNYERLVNEPL